MLLYLDTTLGAAFIGVVVAAGLHGVSCVQAWWYYIHQNDRWPLKLLVAIVMISDTAHQALISHTGTSSVLFFAALDQYALPVYTYLVTNFDNPIQLGLIVWCVDRVLFCTSPRSLTSRVGTQELIGRGSFQRAFAAFFALWTVPTSTPIASRVSRRYLSKASLPSASGDVGCLLSCSLISDETCPVSNGNVWLTGAAASFSPCDFLSCLIVNSFFWCLANSVCSCPPASKSRSFSSSCPHEGCVLAYVALSLQMQTFEQLTHLKSLSVVVNALAAAGDVLIAATLCKLLHSSRTGFHRSDTMIRKLVDGVGGQHRSGYEPLRHRVPGFGMAWSSKLQPHFADGLSRSPSPAIPSSTSSSTSAWDGVIYCNSLLATLNARKMIRGAADGVHTTSENLSLSLREFQPKNTTLSISSKVSSPPSPALALLPSLTRSRHIQRPNTNISIKIDTTQEFNRDVDVDCCDDEKRSAGSAASSAGSAGSAGVRFAPPFAPQPQSSNTHRASVQSSVLSKGSCFAKSFPGDSNAV
ncbi:hypothetical protein HMN09_01342000 [Mycena chlorophos]|uniref:Transmembrane protein n=1 Tax=Mycena chlorophos TaxID=658473 RepID=A0A8H6S1B2_MYCCL|nr:hypothetical protein HMN09_01342000 [Mycena chlorophos]